MSVLLAQIEIPAPPAPPDLPVIVSGGPPEWIAPFVIALVTIVVGGILLYPVLRAWARRLEGKTIGDDLRAELDGLHDRVAELEGVEGRLHELESRVEFSERLLSQQRESAEGSGGR